MGMKIKNTYMNLFKDNSHKHEIPTASPDKCFQSEYFLTTDSSVGKTKKSTLSE